MQNPPWGGTAGHRGRGGPVPGSAPPCTGERCVCVLGCAPDGVALLRLSGSAAARLQGSLAAAGALVLWLPSCGSVLRACGLSGSLGPLRPGQPLVPGVTFFEMRFRWAGLWSVWLGGGACWRRPRRVGAPWLVGAVLLEASWGPCEQPLPLFSFGGPQARGVGASPVILPPGGCRPGSGWEEVELWVPWLPLAGVAWWLVSGLRCVLSFSA